MLFIIRNSLHKLLDLFIDTVALKVLKFCYLILFISCLFLRSSLLLMFYLFRQMLPSRKLKVLQVCTLYLRMLLHHHCRRSDTQNRTHSSFSYFKPKDDASEQYYTSGRIQRIVGRCSCLLLFYVYLMVLPPLYYERFVG